MKTDNVVVGTPGGLGWTTLHHSVAEYSNGRTYVAYVKPEIASIAVRVYDHATRSTGPERTILAGIEDAATVDPHAAPAILVRASDRRVMVWASAHIDKQNFWQWTSDSPESIDSGTVTNIFERLGARNTTYPVISQFESGRLLLTLRTFSGYPKHANARWGYSISDDDGATWSTTRDFWTVPGRGAYVHAVQTGASRVDFALLDGNPGNDPNVALYHLYTTDGATFRRTDGTAIAAAMPWSTADATMVYQPAGSDFVRGASVALDGDPRIAFQVEGADRLNWAKFSGGWATYDVAGYARARTGVAIDPADANTIYSCSDRPPRMTRYATADGGSSWSSTAIGGGGTGPQRPMIPRNADPGLAVVWLAQRSGEAIGWDARPNQRS